MSEIIKKVKEFVEEECKKPSSKYGYEPCIAHFAPVAEYAKTLAGESGADVELAEIAGWLHDMGSIIYGRENHHITGAKIAEEKLKEFGYDSEKIEIVKKCILNHRGSVNNEKESQDEQILADADGMSAFDRIEGIFYAALVSEKLSVSEARKSVKRKLENSYNKLSSSAREIIKPKYDAAMLLLE